MHDGGSVVTNDGRADSLPELTRLIFLSEERGERWSRYSSYFHCEVQKVGSLGKGYEARALLLFIVASGGSKRDSAVGEEEGVEEVFTKA